MKIMGLDLSMTGTGCVVMEDTNIIYQKLISTKLQKNEGGKILDQDDLRRILEIQREIGIIMDITGFGMESCYCTEPRIAIEGPALGIQGKTQSIVTLGKLLGIIEYWLTTLPITYTIIPPTSLKKIITGKGIGKKEVMLKEVYKKFGLDFSDNNLCDAFCLCSTLLPPGTNPRSIKIVSMPLLRRR